MRKFMKYEIKGTYKFILGIVAIVLIASTIIQMSLYRQINSELLTLSSNFTISRGFLVAISILTIFGAFLTAFFYIIGSFRKELYEDRGYLTFTLPLTGNKILGGKMIVALMWYAVLGLSIFLYNISLATILYGSDWIVRAKNGLKMIESGIISISIISIVSLVMTFTLIYFSIALSRVTVKNKKIGGLWFIIFIILNGVLNYISVKIGGLFPYYLNLSNYKIYHFYDIIQSINMTGDFGQLLIYGMNFEPYLNILANVMQVIISVIGFLSTGYLIEKKIDL